MINKNVLEIQRSGSVSPLAQIVNFAQEEFWRNCETKRRLTEKLILFLFKSATTKSPQIRTDGSKDVEVATQTVFAPVKFGIFQS